MISFDATILGPLASKQSISWDISNWLIPPRHYFWAEIIEFFPDQRLDWLFVYIYGLATIFERIDIRSKRIMKLDKNPVNTWCRSHGVRGSRKITGREMRFKKVERAWIRSSTPRRDTFSFVSRLRSIIYFLRKLFHASRRDLSQARIFFFFYFLFLFSTRRSTIQTALLNREILATAKAREVCGQDVCVCVCALLSLSPRHRERRLVKLNVLFIASWKTRKFSSLLSPPRLPSFRIDPITPKWFDTFLIYLFIYLFYESLDLRVFFSLDTSNPHFFLIPRRFNSNRSLVMYENDHFLERREKKKEIS